MTSPRRGAEPAGFDGQSVLIVEDDVEARDIYAAFLGYHGLTIVTASRGEEAIEAVRRRRPDVILMDVSLPEMDGWTVAERLAEVPETSGIPLIMMTAHAHPDEGADRAGFDAFLRKPCEPRDLLREIERVIRP